MVHNAKSLQLTSALHPQIYPQETATEIKYLPMNILPPIPPSEVPLPTDTLEKGRAVIMDMVRRLPQTPGVYRMIDKKSTVLYVGKARNLQRRVRNYTQIQNLPYRLQRMVSETQLMEIVSTHTEAEALLLEANFIKRYKPRYNILLRDNKSYPFILISGDHPAPCITKHRGAQKRKGNYFGPFASVWAVNRTINALQRAFLIRNCSDTVYAARTRPCLQYQIKRCAAPCVGRISEAEYAVLIQQAHDFLSGRHSQLQRELAALMQAASDIQAYEVAARYRDRIQALTFIQGRQDIHVEGLAEADILGVYQAGGQTCIEVFFFRGGQNYGSRAYFPSHDENLTAEAVTMAFIAQFYHDKPPPRQILTNIMPDDAELLEQALSLRAERKLVLRAPKRGAKAKLVAHAVNNAGAALSRHMAENASQDSLLEGVARLFGLKDPPQRIEVYDNSHIQGSIAYGAMIVAGREGLMKGQYRKFSIKGARNQVRNSKLTMAAGPADGFTPGDDYAMMREVLTRRFTRALRQDLERQTGIWPDLILVDGGKGQLAAARLVLKDLGIIDHVFLVAIAKGPDRNAGLEKLYLPNQEPIQLESHDPILYYLQRLRDEAHRFAITTHRAGRQKRLTSNPLDEIFGIGAKRKKSLLHHFGSARAVSRAGMADLEAVEGINHLVAQKIYDHFNHNG